MNDEIDIDELDELEDLEGFGGASAQAQPNQTGPAPSVAEIQRMLRGEEAPSVAEIQANLRSPADPVDANFELPELSEDTIDEIPVETKVAAAATEQTQTAAPSVGPVEGVTKIRQQMDDEGVTAFKPVDEEYSEVLDRVSAAERTIKYKHSQNIANILSTVPKNLQQKYIARANAKFQEAMDYNDVRKGALGGEIYEKLDDDTKVVADKLRQNGVPGIQASKLANKHETVRRVAQDILSEFTNNPQAYDYYQNKLYGAPVKDERTGQVTRENGLIRQNNFGLMDVVNEEAFNNLYKDIEAERAYRRSTTGKDRAARIASGGTSGKSTKSPAQQMLDQIDDNISALDAQVKRIQEKDPATAEELSTELNAEFQRRREIVNMMNSEMEAQRQSLNEDTIPSEGYLKPVIQRMGDRKEDKEVMQQKTDLEAAINTRLAEEPDATFDVKRKIRTEVSKEFAESKGLKMIDAGDPASVMAQLQELGDKPAVVIGSGWMVGADKGDVPQVITRGQFSQWVKEQGNPEILKRRNDALIATQQGAERLLRSLKFKSPSIRTNPNTGKIILDEKLDSDLRDKAEKYNQTVDLLIQGSKDLEIGFLAKQALEGKKVKPLGSR